jgi:NAD-dependent deacetylase
VNEVRNWVKQATKICALTGAGISAESGIPTFRGPGGLWRNFRAEDLATPEAFARDPKLVWEWYLWRRGLIAAAEPNPGHTALAALDCAVVTQNVDGLHQRAGSTNVIEVHGSIWNTRCLDCGQESTQESTTAVPPTCECGGLLRPAVVWFGEGLDARVWHNAEEAVRSADLLLVVGTSAVVYPAASLALLAKQAGARVVEINIGETALSNCVDRSLRGASGEILPQLIA